jgi:hypothetical protein
LVNGLGGRSRWEINCKESLQLALWPSGSIPVYIYTQKKSYKAKGSHPVQKDSEDPALFSRGPEDPVLFKRIHPYSGESGESRPVRKDYDQT